MVTFPHQMEVKVRKNRRERVRVDELKGLIFVRLDTQLVTVGQRLAFQKKCEESLGTDSFHWQRRLRLASANNPGPPRLRQKGTDCQSWNSFRHWVRTQYMKRIGMVGVNDLI